MYRMLLITLASTVTAALVLSGCVESQTPLITDARPLLGQQFEVHLYEDFVDGKATDFHTANYRWHDGQYMRAAERPGTPNASSLNRWRAKTSCFSHLTIAANPSITGSAGNLRSASI